MNTQIKKKISAFLLSLIALFVLTIPAYVNIGIANAAVNFGLGDAKRINVSDSDKDLKNIIAEVVNIALGFLGILAVIIIIFAGFKWMTAGGNEEKVGEAKKMLTQAIIGLAIIFLAYVITNFVVTQMQSAIDSTS